MADSESPYLAIDSATTAIALPSAVSPVGSACSGDANLGSVTSLWGGIGGGESAGGAYGADLVQGGVDIVINCVSGVAGPPVIRAWYEDYPMGVTDNTGGPVFLDGQPGKNHGPLFPITLGQTLTFEAIVIDSQRVRFSFSVPSIPTATYAIRTQDTIDQTTVEAVLERLGSSDLVSPTATGSTGNFPTMYAKWSGVVGEQGGGTIYTPKTVTNIGINEVLTEKGYCDPYTPPTGNLCNSVTYEAITSNGYDCSTAKAVGGHGVIVNVSSPCTALKSRSLIVTGKLPRDFERTGVNWSQAAGPLQN